MKKHLQTIKGYFAGVLTVVLILGLALPANAASILKEIKVSIGGIQIYVDGNLKKPVDANGNAVEPMIYNGTTYLPVRALTNMLTDKEVSWDGNAQTVYIGNKPSNGGKSVPIDTLKIYDGWGKVRTGTDAQFSILGKKHSPFNSLLGSYLSAETVALNVIYQLDSDYTKLTGSLVVPYDVLGSTAQQDLYIYSVDEYGNSTLLDSYFVKAGDAPIKVETNVSGCNFIAISSASFEMTQPGKSFKRYYNGSGVFYDITLTTAN